MKKIRSFVEAVLVGVMILIPAVAIVGNRVDVQMYTYDYASPYIYLMNRTTENTAYQKAASTRTYPAAFTQIMTAIVALEQIDDLTKPVSIDSLAASSDSSMAVFFPEEVVTYEDLFYGMMLSSGEEAANSLAVNISGDTDSFVQLMNQKAAELKLHDTHFTNPDGLHDQDQYTIVSDMAILLDYSLDNELFKALFTAKSYITSSTTEHPNGIILHSPVFEQLQDQVQDGFNIIGGKSSITYEGGQNWATLRSIEDQEYITIVMGAPLEDIHNPSQPQITDTLNLYRKTVSIIK